MSNSSSAGSGVEHEFIGGANLPFGLSHIANSYNSFMERTIGKSFILFRQEVSGNLLIQINQKVLTYGPVQTEKKISSISPFNAIQVFKLDKYCTDLL